MDFDRAFDNIVFGISTPKLRTCLGLYISPEAVYLSEVRITDSGPVTEHLAKIPITDTTANAQKSVEIRTAGSLNTSILADSERLSSIIKPVLTDLGRHSSNLVISLSSHFGLLRYFSIPPMDRRFWQTAIPAEARKLIPIPFSELVYDFQIRPLGNYNDKHRRYGVLFGVIHKKNLDALRALSKRLGVNLLGVELAPWSVERLWGAVTPQKTPESSYAHLHLEGIEGQVIYSLDGWPVLFRTIPISAPEAAMAERRKLDMQGTVDYVIKQLGARPPTEIRVSGTYKELDSWSKAMTQDLGIPCRVLTSGKTLGLKAEEWGAYACVGGALRYLKPSSVALDMSQHSRINDEDRRLVQSIFKLVGITTAFLLILGGVRYIQLINLRNDLKHFRKTVNAVVEFRNKTPDEIKVLAKSMQDKTASVNIMNAQRPTLTEIFQLLQEDVPGPAWINSLSYMATIETTGAQYVKRSLSIQGNVMAEDVDVEQDTANQFRKKLQDDSRMSKVFTCTPTAVEVIQGKSTESETRTRFSISCENRIGGT